MTTPLIRDPKPIADRLVRFIDEPPTPTSVLAVALRAALFECAEEQQVAVIGLGITEDFATTALLCGRIEMANKVVHRIGEALEQLDNPPPALTKEITMTDERDFNDVPDLPAGEDDHCGNDCGGIYSNDGTGDYEASVDCVHCEDCCTCTSCEYARVA